MRYRPSLYFNVYGGSSTLQPDMQPYIGPTAVLHVLGSPQLNLDVLASTCSRTTTSECVGCLLLVAQKPHWVLAAQTHMLSSCLSPHLADATEGGAPSLDVVSCTVSLANFGSASLSNITLDGVDAGCQVGELWPGQSVQCTATRWV